MDPSAKTEVAESEAFNQLQGGRTQINPTPTRSTKAIPQSRHDFPTSKMMLCSSPHPFEVECKKHEEEHKLNIQLRST